MSDELTVEVENVGGIERANYTFDPGVTLVAGPNASNKTSLLSALAFTGGSDDVRLRTAAEEARVALSDGDRTVERHAVRNGRDVAVSGDAWTTDETSTAFETFGCLLEFNPLRTTMRRGDDVGDLLKAPVDIDELERQRSEKLTMKHAHERDLESLDGVEADLEATESDLADARERVSTLEAELEELYERRDEESGEDEELQDHRARRTELATELDRYRDQVTDLEGSIEEYERQRDDLAADIDELERELDDVDADKLRDERRGLQDRRATVEDRLDVFQSILSTNREVIDAGLAGVLDRERDLSGDTVACWTCRQATDEKRVEETLETLSGRIETERERKREFEPRIEELDAEIADYEERERTLRDRRADLREIERKLADRWESLETKREQVASVREELDVVESRLAERESTSSDDLVEKIESTQMECQTARRGVERLESQVADLHEQREERDRKREAVDRLIEEVRELTDRIESLESDLRDEFNDAMDDLLDTLGFDRLERVWLDGSFDIVVAREVDGRVREDAVEHLSESEREMVGLVLGLAGYAVYDVGDATPVLLLDSLDAFDVTRTERLLSFFEDRANFLLAAVLPETADELDGFGRVRPSSEPVLPE